MSENAFIRVLIHRFNMVVGKCPNLPSSKYFCGEAHNAKSIGCDKKRNLRLYRPRGKNGVWIIDSRYRPKSKDFLMKRTTRFRRIKSSSVKIGRCP